MQRQHQKTFIAATILAVVAGAIATMLYAGQRLGEHLAGPSKITRAADNTYWLVSHDKLHQLSADGDRMQVVALADLGVHDVVSGIAIAKNGVVFVAQAAPSSIRRCALPQKKCVDLNPAFAKAAGAPSDALMLAVDDATQRLVVSDNAAHRVLLSDFDGNVSDHSSSQFVFPNQPSWLSSDEVAISDTNHHRIVRIAVKDDKLGEQRGEFSTLTAAFGRPGRIWPMDAQRDAHGQWWVLNAANGMRDADLIRFDEDGKPLSRVDLGVDSDPTAIALTGNGVLVAEPLRASLVRVTVTPEGTRTGPFGDASFQSELQSVLGERVLWKRIRLLAQLLCGLAPLLGIFLLSRLDKQSSTGLVSPESVTFT